MTDLATAITCIDACGMAGVTPKLEADPGVGKSSHLRALAERLPLGRLALLQPPSPNSAGTMNISPNSRTRTGSTSDVSPWKAKPTKMAPRKRQITVAMVAAHHETPAFVFTSS